jgi:menaquinone-9 beta-reductase
MKATPLCIVGAGPAGLSTALFLAARDADLGKRLVVLERARFPREKICAGAIGKRADDALARIGVKIDVPSAPIRGIAVTTGRERAVFRIPEVAGRVVRRIEFDAELARVARSRGIAIEEGVSVKKIERAPDETLALDIEGGEKLHAEAVVGADGVRSIVRRELGFSRGEIVAQVVELDTVIANSDVPDDVIHFDLGVRFFDGYSWDFPTPLGGSTRMCRGSYALRRSTDQKDPSEVAHARLPHEVSPLGPTKRYAERAFVPGAALSVPRAILVGEAAGIDPVLGEGIAQAILGGEVAADYLVPRLRSKDLAFDDWSATLSATSVGRDLARRSAAFSFIYGSGRDFLERHVVVNRWAATTGLRYFGGHISRAQLLGRLKSLVLRS